MKLRTLAHWPIQILFPIFFVLSAALGAHASTCGHDLLRFLVAETSKHEKEFARIPQSKLSSAKRLTILNPKGKFTVYQGGEGVVFYTPRSPDVAIKVWRPKRTSDFLPSTNYLMLTRIAVDSVPELKACIHVSRILERGQDWIVRDFSAKAVPLGDALYHDSAARQVVDALRVKVHLFRNGNRALNRLEKMIFSNPPSANLLWDPVTKKIYVPDMM